jgi:Putative Flp pilus-assembly TadE/G-like
MKRSNRGQVLVLVALAIFALLGLAALGIDVGYMYSVRHELQRSADSGALAGASTWTEPGSAWSSNDVEAEKRAKDYATMDKVLTTVLDRDTEVAVDFPSQDRIRVTTQRTVPLFFARVLWGNSQLISATAVAEASIANIGVKCLKPWGIPVPWIDSTPNDKYDTGETGLDGNSPVNMDGVPPGTQIIIKIAEPFNKKDNTVDLPSFQQEAGHFFALDLCGDRGASDYRNRIMDKCLDDCSVNVGDNLILEPGNMVGPTKQAVGDLMNNPGTWNPATNEADGTGFTDWTDSPRFVHIPVYSPLQSLNSGKVEITVVGFAGFWIKAIEPGQGTVTGYYVPDTSPGAKGSGTGGGAVLRTLRLVE